MVDNPASADGADEDAGRRDFLVLAATAMGVVGAGSFVWPLIDSMNPSAEVLALSTVTLDLEPIETGQSVTVVWQGKPIFVRRRTDAEIATAKKEDGDEMRDPQTDAERAEKPEWLVVIGICTHLGCIPLGQKATDPKGDYNGWFCPCHGSHYDTSGRIRRGPAPLNLELPPNRFSDSTTLLIG